MVVNDQTKDSEIHINIPVKPNLEDMELNEEQLEAVTGGADIYWEVYGGFAPFVWAYGTGKEIGTSIVS
ncbi:hypothetical protein PG911_00510 [Tenacibaculum ovolyticum]|uniref:hypothetical protein n=1 Tax=Tenacibaculum ovolyticum TaxID=104270 RepID=UPI0022F3826E|nr:hypothetical protein [Tenacibaculum ovolyticum]WBX76773.1 hypothetical protein PG911_00510 [Tenacibaculum ovolyticum]